MNSSVSATTTTTTDRSVSNINKMSSVRGTEAINVDEEQQAVLNDDNNNSEEPYEFYIDDEALEPQEDQNIDDNANNGGEFDEKDELLEIPLEGAAAVALASRKKSAEIVEPTTFQLSPNPRSNLLQNSSDFALVQATSHLLKARLDQTATPSVSSSINQQIEESPATTITTTPSTTTTSPVSFTFLDKLDYDERVLMQIANVGCLCDLSRGMHSSSKEVTVNLNGRLVLTTYRLQFIPTHTDDAIDPNRVFSIDRNLLLFACKQSQFSLSIPLTFIFEIRATSHTSEKYKKVKSVLDSANPIVKDVQLRCKNFVTKQFTFNEYLRNSEAITKFVTHLLHYSNSQLIIHSRFHQLLGKINAVSSTYQFGRSATASNTDISSSSSVSAVDKKKELLGLMDMGEHAKRRFYLLPSDYDAELVECGCELFMNVRPGFIEVVPSRFLIDSNMPYCVLPKSIGELVTRRRVVINESNVSEFVNPSGDSTDSTGSKASDITSQSGVSSSSSSSKTPSYSDSKSEHKSGKKHSRLSDFISSSSRAAAKRDREKSGAGGSSMASGANIGSSSSGATMMYISQDPILAQLPASNPFYDNRFPMWSFTEPNTLCSIIVVPESLPNRQDECDAIIKNYNCFLTDEVTKLTKSRKQAVNDLKRVASNFYSDYQYAKFQAPFSTEKITSSYIRLLELCSFKTQWDFYKEIETFYSRLQSTKWLRNVSTLLSLTSKIVNSIAVNRRNVFLDERRNNPDCSCILTSLAKICLNPKYRSIVGFENLVQKDWFLVGHPFNRRLYSTSLGNFGYGVGSASGAAGGGNSSEDPNGRRASIDSTDTQLTASSQSQSNESSGQPVTPTFLLFLDCLFQLLLQYPNEFEYNEAYLIQVWELALSGLSFTHSFNGVSDWLSYLSSSNNSSGHGVGGVGQNSELRSYPPGKLDPAYLNDLFTANSRFWWSQLDSNRSSLTTPGYDASSVAASEILVPCEKIYMLKFWSRCYLKSLEKCHSYNAGYSSFNPTTNISSTVLTKTPRPPPLPPKQTPQAVKSEPQVTKTEPEIISPPLNEITTGAAAENDIVVVADNPSDPSKITIKGRQTIPRTPPLPPKQTPQPKLEQATTTEAEPNDIRSGAAENDIVVVSSGDNADDDTKITIKGQKGNVIVTTTIKADGSIESAF